MRVRHRLPDRGEQLQSFVYGQLTAVAIGRDRLALDVLHREKRCIVRRHACVKETRNVRVLQPREDPALDQEPLHVLGGSHGAPDQLQRNPAAHVFPFRQEHASHAAAPDFLPNRVRPDGGAGTCIGLQIAGDWHVQPLRFALIRLQQRVHLSAEVGVLAGVVEKLGANFGRAIQGVVKEALDAFPLVGRHRLGGT